MISSKQRAFLRSKATALSTIFQIGKNDITENLLSTVDDALTAHELVKLRCLETSPVTPREAADRIAHSLDAECVQVIGTKFVLFRISPNHRIYDLDKCALMEERKEKKTGKADFSHPPLKENAKKQKYSISKVSK